MVKYVPSYTKGTFKKKKKKKKKKTRGLIKWCLCNVFVLFFLFLIFSDFLYKKICYRYSFELHQQEDKI